MLMRIRNAALWCVAAVALAMPLSSALGALTILPGTGTAGTTSARDAFRTILGGGTVAGANGSFGGVRREINWDGVPDANSAPNNLPANFFNTTSPRGAVFVTPGTAVQVSSTAAVGNVEFNNINPTYSLLFSAFSPERLFTAIGSNIVDVNFFVPGTNTPGLTRGFGAVFSDVDLAAVTSIEYFDAANVSLGRFFVPNDQGNETLSFLGVDFGAPVVSRVRITAGNAALGAAVNETVLADLVTMDDFIYAEPTAVPEAGTLGLLALGAAGLLGRRRVCK
jgi:hypothetical protein